MVGEPQVVPRTLYKYLPPERIHALGDCRVRFSQRGVFKDDHELQPDYNRFGDEGEIWRFIISRGFRLDPRIPGNLLVRLIAESPKYQQRAVQVAVNNIASVKQMGIFCLTEVYDSEQMWSEYALGGFVIALDTTHAGFNALKAPGIFGKVHYSDVAIGSFLGMIETDYMAPLFRKRMRYAFEREWRILRLFKQLEHHADGIFLSQFDPACLSQILVRADCTVRRELEGILARDSRYAHVVLSA